MTRSADGQVPHPASEPDNGSTVVQVISSVRRPWPFLALMLAASGALSIAFTTGIIARPAGASTA